MGFSLASPDLVCVGSPDFTNQRYEESPECLLGERVDVSLENGIKGSEMRDSFEGTAAKMDDLLAEASFELATAPLVEEGLSNNEGSTRSEGEVHFYKEYVEFQQL